MYTTLDQRERSFRLEGSCVRTACEPEAANTDSERAVRLRGDELRHAAPHQAFYGLFWWDQQCDRVGNDAADASSLHLL